MIDTFPDDVATAVRRAADAVPPSTHDLAAVQRRHRAYRRRRRVTTVGLALLVGAVTVAVPLAVRGGPAAAPDHPPAGDPSSATSTAPVGAAPAQRLMLRASDQRMQIGAAVTTLDVPDGMLELRADGSVAAYPQTTVMDRPEATFALPDGRLVQLGAKDLRPGVEREDGPWVTDVDFVLAIVAPDGTAQVRRNVRVMGEDVQLIGATDKLAYLVRGTSRIVSHDLATGVEKPLAGATAAFGAYVREVGINDTGRYNWVSVQGDRLVMYSRRMMPGGTGGRLRIADLTSGAQIIDVRLAEPVAQGINDVRVSPDGRLAAVYAGRFVDNPAEEDRQRAFRIEHRFLVVDVATGRLLVNRLIIDQLSHQMAEIIGMAWTDNNTVRVASYAMSLGDPGNFLLADVLRVETVAV